MTQVKEAGASRQSWGGLPTEHLVPHDCADSYPVALLLRTAIAFGRPKFGNETLRFCGMYVRKSGAATAAASVVVAGAVVVVVVVVGVGVVVVLVLVLMLMLVVVMVR